MSTETTVSQYDQQAEKFLSDNVIKFRATLSDTKTAPGKAAGEKCGHHYRVTLSGKIHNKSGRVPYSLQMLPRRLTFDFWGGIADAEKMAEFKRTTPPAMYPAGRPDLMPGHPTAYDVLACISSDVNCPETFADFCSECGDSEDSIKAPQAFRRCSAFAKRLQAFFTTAELEQLSEIN